MLPVASWLPLWTAFQRSYFALATKKTTVEPTKPNRPAFVTTGLPNKTMAAQTKSDAHAPAITTLEGGHLERSDINAPTVVHAASSHHPSSVAKSFAVRFPVTNQT